MSSMILAFQAQPQGAGASLVGTLGMWALIIVIFYFLVFAPVRKQKKMLQKMIDELKKGDKVITNGGLHGEVAGVEATSVLLKIADNVKGRVSKSAIAGLQGDGDPGSTR